MVPAEFQAQDHAYKMLKFRLQHDLSLWTDPINIVQLADEFGLSRTPVREAVFRLLGEGVLESANQGGYRLYRPAIRQLRELYAWEDQLVLAAIRSTRDEDIVRVLRSLRNRVIDSASVLPWRIVPDIFEGLGEATGNGEFSRQIRNTNERLLTARQVEITLFDDLRQEARSLLDFDDADARDSLADRINLYHRRRLEKAIVISMDIQDL
jgi:DNA-binding GntR family transcriptional regulator